MDFHKEKVEYISQMDAFSKVGLIRVRLKAKIIFSFILMGLFTEDLSKIPKKMDLENLLIITDSNIKVFGKMTRLMVLEELKIIQMVANILGTSIKALNKEKDNIFGLMEKCTLDNLKMDIWRVEEYLKKVINLIFKVFLLKIKSKEKEN